MGPKTPKYFDHRITCAQTPVSPFVCHCKMEPDFSQMSGGLCKVKEIQRIAEAICEGVFVANKICTWFLLSNIKEDTHFIDQRMLPCCSLCADQFTKFSPVHACAHMQQSTLGQISLLAFHMTVFTSIFCLWAQNSNYQDCVDWPAIQPQSLFVWRFAMM